MPTKELFSGLKKVEFFDPAINGAMDILQRQIEKALFAIARQTILNGQSLIDVLSFVSDVNITLDHKLGRVPEGFVVTNTDGPIVVYKGPPARLPDRQIILRAHHAVPGAYTFSVWIY